jgi:TonB family protein
MALSSRRSAIVFTTVILVCSIFSASSPAQTQPDATSKRRVVERSAPVYPPLARNLALEGVVRLEAVVAPDGSVKTVVIKGGHPVLAQAAVKTVSQWKWERAPRESSESVEVKFSRE